MLHRPATVKFKRGVQGFPMEVNSFFDDSSAPPREEGQPLTGPAGMKVREFLF